MVWFWGYYNVTIQLLFSISSSCQPRSAFDVIVANPEGLVTGQTTTVKGGGSALMDYMLRRFKSKGVKSVRIFSINDKYYADRGWQEELAVDSPAWFCLRILTICVSVYLDFFM
jgi:hypothetical protein